LEGAELGASLSSLMQNMPQLHRLDCVSCVLREEGVRALQPALQANRTLKDLSFSWCGIQDGGVRLIADALVGNATMDTLDIGSSHVTSNCLDDFSRMPQSTRLKTINFWRNIVFNDTDATQRFVSTLQHKCSTVQELPLLGQRDFPGDEDSQGATFASINICLTRNQQLNRADLLLLPPPRPRQQQQHPQPPGSTTTTMFLLETWHKAIAKFAIVPNNAGVPCSNCSRHDRNFWKSVSNDRLLLQALDYYNNNNSTILRCLILTHKSVDAGNSFFNKQQQQPEQLTHNWL
jgi:Leucine Rich repeat